MTAANPASSTIAAGQQELLGRLPFDDTQDFDDANRGLIARREPNAVTSVLKRLAAVLDPGDSDFAIVTP